MKNWGKFAAAALLSGAFLLGWTTAAAGEPAGAATHAVSWDERSLKIDGKRVFIWSGEMHIFRLPSPSLWRDVLQKMKAIGFNTVTYYIAWGYHTPAPGVYDFTGIRDVELALRMAEEEGLYVILRPGPYVNAELSRGGFPTWLTTLRPMARTDAPEYLAAADEWLTRINAIVARHQITSGGGTVIAYQIENELLYTTPAHARYLQHLYDRARADGITVPIFHNDIGRNGYWVPRGSSVPNTVEGPSDLYAWDSYPGGTCRFDAKPGAPHKAPDFGWYGAGGARGGSSASPHTPGFTSEFGNGWFDYWGSNGSYACIAERLGRGYERVFYGTNIANGLTMQSFYMLFGGTSWGWQPGPIVYTSYDYGAAIDEGRGLRDKAYALKPLGLFVQAAEATLAGMQKGPAIQSSSPAVKLYHNVNPDNGAHLIVATHDPSNALTNDTFSFSLVTADGRYDIPQAGTLRVNGQDAKLLLGAFDIGGQRLVYSTSQLETYLQSGDEDIVLLYAPRGEDGETVLRYQTAPTVRTLQGNVQTTFDVAKGDLRLNYTHQGLARVAISGGGRPPLLLLLADENTARGFWRQETSRGAVLSYGPALVRSATIEGNDLRLAGDTIEASALEVWAPQEIASLSWNGHPLGVKRMDDGSLSATAQLPGAENVTLPDIWSGVWRMRPGSPEADRNFDDSGWKPATAEKSATTTHVPVGLPVLTMDDYGFHQGDVWYRGRYQGDGISSRLELTYGAGGAGMLQVWLDGRFLGQDELPATQVWPQTVGTAVFTIPPKLRARGAHVLAVMVRNNAHNWDVLADDAFKEGRGLITASLSPPTGPSYAVPIAWKLHGMGETLTDPVRGVMNNGGQYGEMHGWHLPGFDDGKWRRVHPGTVKTAPGTTWLRTEFDLALPADHDVQLGLVFGKPDQVRSARHYRVLMYVNGWLMGQYVANVGPQHVFVIPPGIIHGGRNTLALAVTSDGNPRNALEPVRLQVLRKARGGLPVEAVASPDFQHWSKGTH